MKAQLNDLLQKMNAIMDHSENELSGLDKSAMLSLTRRIYDTLLGLEDSPVQHGVWGGQNSDLKEQEERMEDLFAKNLDSEAEQLYSRAQRLGHTPLGMPGAQPEAKASPASPSLEKDTADSPQLDSHIPASADLRPETREQPIDNTRVLRHVEIPDVPETPRSAPEIDAESIREFNQEVEDLFRIAGSNELSNKLASSPLDSLKRAISINDRLLYAKVLFGGDDDLYHQTISAIDQGTSLHSVENQLRHLAQKFEWASPNKQGIARSFVQIVKRRFA